MYEFEEFQRQAPRSPWVWVLPLFLMSIGVFVYGIVSLSVPTLPQLFDSEDAMMVVGMFTFFIGMFVFIIVIANYYAKRDLLMRNLVISPLIQRVSMEMRHPFQSEPLTAKTPIVSDCHELFRYNTIRVGLHLTVARIPTVSIQQLMAISSSGKSSSTTFNGIIFFIPTTSTTHLIVRPNIRWLNFFMGGQTKIELSPDTPYAAYGNESALTPEVDHFYRNLIELNPALSPLLSITNGYIKLAVTIPYKRFTPIRQFTEDELLRLTDDVRRMLIIMDDLLTRLEPLQIA